VANNATGAQELWLRGGFEWRPLNNVTIKDQVYSYQAKRNWLDSETYAFSLTAPGGALPCPGAQPACIDRDRFAVFHNQNIFGNNADLTWDSLLFGMENRFAAQLQTSSNRITFKEDISEPFPDDTVSVVNPQPGLYGPLSLSTRNSTLDDIAGAFEDRLKLTPAFALIGGVRVDRLTLSRDGVNADGTIPTGLPFSVSWEPVSYRAAYTYEPIRGLMFYSMYATAYNPAVAAVFSITPGTSLQLTSSRIYETGAKQQFWDNKAEWTIALYDIVQRNVFIPISTTETVVAGEVTSKGVELAAAVARLRVLNFGARFHPCALWQFRFVYRQRSPECGSPHCERRRRLSFRSLAMAARGRRLDAVCGKPFFGAGQPYNPERVHNRGRLCVPRYSRPRRCDAGTRQRANLNARAQFDECSLCRLVRHHVPGSNPPRRATDLCARAKGAKRCLQVKKARQSMRKLSLHSAIHRRAQAAAQHGPPAVVTIEERRDRGVS
jgi:hypothetical protein